MTTHWRRFLLWFALAPLVGWIMIVGNECAQQELDRILSGKWRDEDRKP